MSSGRITRANQQSIQRGQQRRGGNRNGTGAGAEHEGLGKSTSSIKELVEDVSKDKEVGRVTRARNVLSASVVNGVGLRARRRSTMTTKEEEKPVATESPNQKKRILEVVIPTSPIMPVNATASSSSPTPKGMSLRRGRTGSVSTASVTSSTADQVPVKTRTSTRVRRQKEQSMTRGMEKTSEDREADKDKRVVDEVVAIAGTQLERRSRSATSSGLSSPAEELIAKTEPESSTAIDTQAQSELMPVSRPLSPTQPPPISGPPIKTESVADAVKPNGAPALLPSDPPRDVASSTTGILPCQISSTSIPPSPQPTSISSARSNRSTVERPRTAAAERSSRRSAKHLLSPGKLVDGTQAVHSLRSTKGHSKKPCDVPFPPLELLDSEQGGLSISQEEKENGSLAAEDLKDEKLMAVCAALDLFGNRALTAIEIGDACVNQGWMRPSPALPSSSLVQSAIRAYQRRCATHRPERICLIRKHILAGYAMESRLIPALHPSAAQDGCRRKGMVFYLEGQVGHRVWTNPFDTLQDMDATADAMEIDKTTQEPRSRKNAGVPKGKQAQPKVQPPHAVSPPSGDVDMDAERPPVQERPSGLKIKIKLGGVYNGAAEPISYSPPEDDFAMAVEQDTAYESSSDQYSSEDSSEEESSFEGREDSYAFPQYGEDESDDSDEPDDTDGLPRNTSIKDLARSFFMDSPPQDIVTEPLPNHVRFSPLPSSTSSIFPANPLDSGIFDDTEYMPALSPPDEHAGSSSDDEDEAATEFMDTLDYGRLRRISASTKRVNFHAMAYRDAFSPVDLDGSEVDTPATTPRTYCDDEEEADLPNCNPTDEAMDADKVDIDDDLQKAVQVLGQLLPNFSDPSDSVQESELFAPQEDDYVETTAAIPDQQDLVDISPQVVTTSTPVTTRTRRKSSVGARDFLRLSLPFPICPGPSPLQSPAVPNQSGLDDEFLRFRGLDQIDNAPALQSLDCDKGQHSASDMELLPDLDRQLALTDCELACVCNPEPSSLTTMEIDSPSRSAGSARSRDAGELGTTEAVSGSLEAELMEGMQDPQAWADLLGPESVGLEELDNVWGFMNAAVAAVAAGQTTRRRKVEADTGSVASTRSDSSDKTLQQKDVWGAIGVGGVGSSRRLEHARFRKALLSKAKALAGAKFSTSPTSPRRLQRVEQSGVEEEEAIGLEDVADAFISAWADGDTILEEDSLDLHTANATAATMDEQPSFTTPLYAESNDHPIGVCPSVLTNPVKSDAVATHNDERGVSSDTKRPHSDTKAIKTGLDASPLLATPPVVTTPQRVDLPLQTGGGSSNSSAIANNLLTVPGISTRFPIKLPAPPRRNVHTKDQPVAAPTSLKGDCQGDLTSVPSDLFTLTSVPWKGTASCRRIVPDYVNFSAVLRAVDHPNITELEEQLQRIPTSVTLRDGPPIANGIWLPLDIAETEAERAKIPNALHDMSLRTGLKCQTQSLSPPVKPILAAQTADVPSRVSRGPERIPEPLAPRSHTQTPTQMRPTVPQASPTNAVSTMTPSKRLNSSTVFKSGEPAKKRRKSSIATAPLDSARPITRAQKHNSRKSLA